MKNDIETFVSQYITDTEEVVSIFLDLVEYVEYTPQEYLVKINEYTSDFYIIKEGIVRSFLLTDKGKDTTTSLFLPGEISGAILSMVRNAPSDINYQALTNVKVYKANFHELKKRTLSSHKLATFYVKLLEKVYIMLEKIIFDISTLDATERYLELREAIPNIDNIIAQKYIASYLNITPVQLSRIRKSLYSSTNSVI
ncbi:Crp/Fnr family transcriptional regulator [Tenacibaculum sp. 190524A02b]